MICALITFSSLALSWGDPPDAWCEVELQPRLLSIEAIELPDPPWRLAGSAIELDGGRRFALRGGAGGGDGARVEVDVDGDGDFDLSLRGEGNGSIARLRVGGPGVVYPVRLRVAPSDGQLEWAPVGVMRGRVLGTTIAVVDLSGNGRYDDFGVDAILLGGERKASYLSRVVSIDGELVELLLSAEGRRAAARRWRGETGLVDARAGFRSGGELVSATLRSGELAFELGRARGGMWIPAGEYELVRGRVAAGACSARIERGAMAPWIVSVDRPLVPEWGGPLSARCDAFFEAGVMHVLLFTLAAEGRAGERYLGFQPRYERPTIRVRDAESGRALGSVDYLSDERGEWGAFLVQVDETARIQVDLRHELPLFGPTPVEVVENPTWKRRDLGL